MALPTNILQQVQTYQASNLAYLLNLFAFIGTSNTRFKDFENLEANLGSTVTFDLPPRFTTAQSLVATFQGAQQRVQNLTVANAVNTAYAFSDQQFIFNVRDYMEKFGKSATLEIATQIEANVANNAITNTYRFFGDGVTPINSFGQLANALAFFRNYGAAKDLTRGYLSDIAVPSVVNSGLNQFVTGRNEQYANTWMLGNFSNCDWYQSNLLSIQNAGTVGNSAQLLTVVSTNDPTGQAITQITFSGATPNDVNAIKAGDLLQFQDGVSGQPNLRYLTFIGHQPSSNPVQFQATANAAANGSGDVTISITPTLDATADQNQNILYNIVAGMQAKALPSHKAGLLTSGNSLFLAMPRLPEEIPFPTANKTDPDTGVSLRMYYGSLFGQNQRGFVHDVIWGSTLVPEYSMRLVFPLTQ